MVANNNKQIHLGLILSKIDLLDETFISINIKLISSVFFFFFCLSEHGQGNSGECTDSEQGRVGGVERERDVGSVAGFSRSAGRQACVPSAVTALAVVGHVGFELEFEAVRGTRESPGGEAEVGRRRGVGGGRPDSLVCRHLPSRRCRGRRSVSAAKARVPDIRSVQSRLAPELRVPQHCGSGGSSGISACLNREGVQLSLVVTSASRWCNGRVGCSRVGCSRVRRLQESRSRSWSNGLLDLEVEHVSGASTETNGSLVFSVVSDEVNAERGRVESDRSRQTVRG